MDVRLDHAIHCVVAFYQKKMESFSSVSRFSDSCLQRLSQDEECSLINECIEFALQMKPDITDCSYVTECDEKSSKPVSDDNSSSSPRLELLDMDGQKGRLITTVMARLVLSPHKNLVTEALELLFRQYGQYEEFSIAMRQIQVLCDEQDITVFQQLRNDINRLKNLVEQSELWIKKVNAVDLPDVTKLELEYSKQSAVHNFFVIENILTSILRVCEAGTASYAVSASSYPSYRDRDGIGCESVQDGKHRRLQEMLHHLGLHLVLVQLLNAPFHITNGQTDEILHLAKRLIFLFCEGNETNQQIMLQYAEQFLTEKVEDVLVLTTMVAHISQLPPGLQSKIIRHMVRSIQHSGPRFCWLRPLTIILSSHKTPLRTLQDMVLSELFSLGEHVFSKLLNPAIVIESMEQFDMTTKPTFDDVVHSVGDTTTHWELIHAHLQLIEILSLGSAGSNTFVQLQCQTWFSLSNVVNVLTTQIKRSDMLCHPMHQIYLTYVENVFFSGDDGNKRIWTPGSPIWILWVHIAEEFEKFLVDQNSQLRSRIGAINDTLHCLKSFFQTSTGQSSSVIKAQIPLIERLLNSITKLSSIPSLNVCATACLQTAVQVASLSNLRVALEDVNQPKPELNQNGPPLKRFAQALRHFQAQHKFSIRPSRSNFRQKRQSSIVGATSVLETLSQPRESIVECAITPQTHNAIAVDSGAQKDGHWETEASPLIEKHLEIISEGITLKLKPLIEAKHALLVSAVCTLSRQPVSHSPSDQAVFGPDAFFTAIIRHAHQLIDTEGDSRLVDLLEMLQHVVRTKPVHELLETVGPKTVHFIASSTLAEPTVEQTRPRSKTHRALCELIVRCVTASGNNERVFIKSVELANGLLQDGSQQIQNTIYDILTGDQSNAQFFHAIFRRLHHTQTQMSTENGLLRTENPASTKTQKLAAIDCNSNKVHDSLPPTWTELLLSTRPLLYFLHQLCSSHHAGFQNLLRCQPKHLTSYNLIEETQLILTSLTGTVASTSDACQIRPLEAGKKIVLRSDNPTPGRPSRRHTVSVVNLDKSSNQLLDLGNNFVSTTTDCLGSPKVHQVTTPHNPTTQKVNRVWSSNLFLTSPSILEFVLLLLSCLTEFCQGPCSANQDLLLDSPNSYILEVIVKLATEIPSQLNRNMSPKLMCVSAKLKLQAAKLLLALVEGRHDDLVARRLLTHLPSVYLLKTVRRHYECALQSHLSNNTVRTTIEEVGHCLYILAQQLSPHCSVLRAVLLESTQSDRESKSRQDSHNTIQQRDAIVRALRFYQQKTAQIEIVGKEDVIEKLSFPIPPVCRYLSPEYQNQMLASCPLDERSSKFPALFGQLEDVFAEILCKQTLLARPIYNWFLRNSIPLTDACFYLTVCINCFIVLCYPFEQTSPVDSAQRTIWFHQYPITLWPLLPSFCLASVCFVTCVPIYVTIGLGSLCFLVYAGAERAILILGSINVVLRITNLYVLFDEYRVKNRCRQSSLTIFRHTQVGRTRESNVHKFGHLVKSEREQKCTSNASKESANFIPSSAVRSDNCENFTCKIRKYFATQQSRWRSWFHTVLRQLSGRIYLQFGFTLVTILGVTVHPFFHSVVLLDVVNREETLLNVIRSVTKNGQSILLTAILALVIIYIYALLGYVYFKDDFVLEVEPLLVPAEQSQLCQQDIASETSVMNNSSNTYDAQANRLCSPSTPYDPDGLIEAHRERHCDSLRMCILTTLHEGLRNGGGIADVLRRPSIQEADFLFRTIYDLSFFVIVIIIVLNLVFGVIVDTFAALRQEKQDREELARNNCCVCGLQRSVFEQNGLNFDTHVTQEHNIWHYLCFLILLHSKSREDLTGPEGYVTRLLQTRDLSWVPTHRAMSLISTDTEHSNQPDEVVQQLVTKLENTANTVSELEGAVRDLKNLLLQQRADQRKSQLMSIIVNAQEI
ncbi:hypothetical protein EG68_00315 [Paragonimus skrjabini miyazakii]|uniref:Ion transport domain-containing protein n=1 Tax=Paragonimus skrjabini miyazakii TaxID=59628 RepID=A0A8S9ZCH4_9TREM|nr:hypothetical protein EG68_00315 [Paragonimus skrjabini miyazakii]